MTWQDETDQYWALIADNLAGPGWLYGYERRFWHELWRVPVIEAVDEDGIQVRHYGPIRVFVVAGGPRTPQFNLVLAATTPGSVKRGHLAAALDWTESLGVDCRVPVRPDFGEPEAVEDHLNQRGYRRTATLTLFVRSGEPPDFPEPPGIEIDEITEEIFGFDDFFAGGDEFWTGNSFLMGLPGRRDWRSYIAVDAKNEEGMGAATMMLHPEVAQLGFAATYESARGRGAHMALLHRRIVDALAAGSRRFLAVTEEPLDYPLSKSIAARNLARAGFREAAAPRTVWRPPEELVAQDDDEDEDELDGDDGPDEDHDFEFKY